MTAGPVSSIGSGSGSSAGLGSCSPWSNLGWKRSSGRNCWVDWNGSPVRDACSVAVGSGCSSSSSAADRTGSSGSACPKPRPGWKRSSGRNCLVGSEGILGLRCTSGGRCVQVVVIDLGRPSGGFGGVVVPETWLEAFFWPAVGPGRTGSSACATEFDVVVVVAVARRTERLAGIVVPEGGRARLEQLVVIRGRRRGEETFAVRRCGGVLVPEALLSGDRLVSGLGRSRPEMLPRGERLVVPSCSLGWTWSPPRYESAVSSFRKRSPLRNGSSAPVPDPKRSGGLERLIRAGGLVRREAVAGQGEARR